MNDLEDALHSALHQLGEQTAARALSGPALRRKARVRSLRVRTGGVAVVGAAAVTGVVVAPSLISTPSPRSVAATGAPSALAPTTTSKTVGTDPVGKAQPSASFTGKPAPSAPTATPAKSATKASADGTWTPAGALISDPIVLSVAPKVAATDQDWKSWGGQLLDRSTVGVVFADWALIRSSGPDDLRPLVVVTGRTSPDAPLQLAVLSSMAGGVDASNLSALTVEAMTPAPADGAPAIAVSNGLTLYVAADGGIDDATYTYRDGTGEHTAAMKVAGGVATAVVPSADLKAGAVGEITRVTARSHGTVVWDAAPVAGR